MRSPELPDFFQANRAKLDFHNWLTEALQPHCRIRRMGWRGSRLRLIQFPTEFAAFLIYLKAHQVKSYLEIGVSSGGSIYTADAYLRAAFPDYQRSRGYDRINKIRYLAEYQQRCPTFEFQQINSRNIALGAEKWDCAFIDARHIEKWVLQDFEKVRHNARIVAFHDIALEGSTVGAAWAKIKAQFPAGASYEFIDPEIKPEARCGIGVLNLTQR